MYNVVVKTTNSETPFGAQISSTKRLHEFLCSMDFQLVTSLEVKYYRELKSPHELNERTDTGATDIVSLISHGPDSWEVTTPKSADTTKPRNVRNPMGLHSIHF
jgi:hypothetical protein